MMQLSDREYLTIAEASQRTGYCKAYLRRLVSLKLLMHLRVGRTLLTDANDVARYLKEAWDSGDNRCGPQLKSPGKET